MSLSSLADSLRAAWNRAQLGSLSALFKTLAFGDVIGALITYLREKPTAVIPYVQGSTVGIQLPDKAKAAVLLNAYARAGGGTPAVLVVDNGGLPNVAAPSAGHAGLSWSGDIVFAGADTWTSVDATYVPEKQDVFEQVFPCATNACTLPTTLGGIVSLLEVESLAGTLVSKLEIIAVGGSPSTGQACLANDKLTVKFYSGDAVTSARVKFGVVSAVDVATLLEGESGIQ